MSCINKKNNMEYKKLEYFLILIFLTLIILLNLEFKSIIGITIILLIVISIYSLFYFALKMSNSIEILKSLSKKEKNCILLLSIISIIFVYSEISRDKFIYYGDFSNFWSLALQQLDIFLKEPLLALKNSYINICYAEHNVFMPTMIAIPLKILGGSYMSYVLILEVIFIIPTCITYALIMKKIIIKMNYKNVNFSILFLFFLILPSLYYPTLSGYIDIVCVFIVSLCILLTMEIDFLKFEKRKCLALSGLLLVLVLMRRAYGYWIVGYAISLFVYMIFNILTNRKDLKIIIKAYMKNLLFIFIVCSLVLVIMFPNFLKNIATSNIRVVHSAWNMTSSKEKIIEFVNYYGVYMIILSILSIITSFKDKYLMSFVVKNIVNIIIVAILFSNIQMGPHQYYQITGQLSLLVAVTILKIYNSEISKRNIIVLTIGILHIYNFLYAHNLVKQYAFERYIFTERIYEPRKRYDIEQMNILYEKIEKLIEKDSLVYVLSSSDILNDDLIRCLKLPERISFENKLVGSYQVDLRDGFPVSFLNSDIIIVPDPIQYHLKPNDQQVVIKLAKEILDKNSIIGDNFKLVDSVSLEKDVKAKIYIKNKDFSLKEINYLENMFDFSYKEYPDLFKNRFEEFKQQENLK
ncbi:hypothetical protein [Clostridioides sp. ES-W-0016-02]|uniref:hypothetical protein n=1 Tax=Clostridioides sp. ES-W-0016-02 TaxID=2770788 RepID=UPI001D11211C|nr:hypothetical protein IC758_15170 [Clostridioides sp. ES-W-0016-02]